MPVTSYQSFVPEPTDTKEVRMTKLHLGIMSLEEQLYSYNADLAETRKKFEELDKQHKILKEEYERLKLCE